MNMYTVSRGTYAGNPDVLFVEGEHGELAVFQPMQPPHMLSPNGGDEARSRPWFFTGSPFGPHIIGLAWERHGLAQARGKG